MNQKLRMAFPALRKRRTRPQRCAIEKKDADGGLFFRALLRRFVPSNLKAAFIACNLLSFLSGCESYRPMPLDEQAVTAALAVPSDDDLQHRSDKMTNARFRPLERLELHPELGLTPDEAALIAVVIHPSLRAQRDTHGLAQAALLQAGILPNPQLTGSYDWNTGGTFPGAVNAYGIGLNYDITALISHAAKEKSAWFAAKSVDLNIAWQEWQTALAAKSAVYDVLSLQGQEKLAGEVDDRLADNLKLVEKAADLGIKTAVDVAAAESASRDAHATVLQTNRDLQLAKLALNRAMGVPPQTVIQLRRDLKLPAAFTPPDTMAVSQKIQWQRLDLLGLRQGYQAQEQTLVAACLDQFPRINLGFSRNRDNTNVRSLGLGVAIDIPIFDRNQGTIATEKANRQKLFDEYTFRVFDARADIAQAVANIAALDHQIEDANAALPSLQKLVELYKEAVDHGNTDVLSYYLAWNNLTQKNLDVLKMQQQLADNRIALEAASGQYFPQEAEPTSIQPTASPATKETRP
jgi:cobalt-zinc-cadmium efflux system outer membrane protein